MKSQINKRPQKFKFLKTQINIRTPNWSAAGENFEIYTVFKGKNVMVFKVISAPLQFGENQETNKRPPKFLDSQKLKLISAPQIGQNLGP